MCLEWNGRRGLGNAVKIRGGDLLLRGGWRSFNSPKQDHVGCGFHWKVKFDGLHTLSLMVFRLVQCFD